MSWAFAALLVSILTLGLAIIIVMRRVFLLVDNINRIPAKNVIYLIHELTVYPFVTSLQLLGYILRSVVASIGMINRLVVIIT